MIKGTLRVVEGDATEPQTTAPNEIVIIPHVCNNGVNGSGIGVMGAGIAKTIRSKWPKVYTEYKKMEDRDSEGLKNRLGENNYVKIDNHLVIVNMIAQDGTVSETNPKPVKYKALADCMTGIVGYIKMIKKQTSNPIVIHTCKFGVGLAKGDWNFILELIREIWIEQEIDVVIYEFKK